METAESSSTSKKIQVQRYKPDDNPDKHYLNEETDNKVHLRNGLLLYGHTDDSQLKPFFERVSNKLKDEDI